VNTRDIGQRRIGTVTASLAVASVAGTLAVAGAVGLSRTASAASTPSSATGGTSDDDAAPDSGTQNDDPGGSFVPNFGGGLPLTGGHGPGQALSGGS